MSTVLWPIWNRYCAYCLHTSGMPDTYQNTMHISCAGKTMTANAVANYLKKKILLVTVSVMMERDLTKVLLTWLLFYARLCRIFAYQELLRFLFREAKIHNAVLFFDECESLFESRENRTNPSLGIMLTEVSQQYLNPIYMQHLTRIGIQIKLIRVSVNALTCIPILFKVIRISTCKRDFSGLIG